METINNLASKAANVVAGKNNTTGTYENVTHSMPENDSIGGSSKPNYEGTTDPLGHTNSEAPIGGPSSTAHSNVKEPGFTQNPSQNSSEMGARDDIVGTSHLGKGTSNFSDSNTNTSEPNTSGGDHKSDPLGHTNAEEPIGGPSSTAHSNVKEPGFTQESGSEEMGARNDIKGAEDYGAPKQGIATAPRAADSKADAATDTKGTQSAAHPSDDQVVEGEDKQGKEVKDDDGHVLKPGSAEAKVQGKSVLPTDDRPYGNAGIPEVVNKDLKGGAEYKSGKAGMKPPTGAGDNEAGRLEGKDNDQVLEDNGVKITGKSTPAGV